MNRFVFLHTHELTADLLRRAVESQIPIEVDISIDDAGELYVGHPLSWYDNFHSTRPALVGMQDLATLIKNHQAQYVVDLKDRSAVDGLIDFVQRLGVPPAYIHLFAEALVMDYHEMFSEPQRFDEDIPDDQIGLLKTELNVPIIVSARRADEVDEGRIMAGLERLDHDYDVVNCYAGRDGYGPEVSEYLTRHGKKILQNVDVDKQLRDDAIGVTDDIATAESYVR